MGSCELNKQVKPAEYMKEIDKIDISKPSEFVKSIQTIDKDLVGNTGFVNELHENVLVAVKGKIEKATNKFIDAEIKLSKKSMFNAVVNGKKVLVGLAKGITYDIFNNEMKMKDGTVIASNGYMSDTQIPVMNELMKLGDKLVNIISKKKNDNRAYGYDSKGKQTRELGSDAETAVGDAGVGGKQYEGFTNNSKKIKGIMQELRSKDSVAVEDEHYKLLEDIVDRFAGAVEQKIPELTMKLVEIAGKNGGKINLDAKKITIMKGMSGTKSLPEVFAHEYLHAVFEYASEMADTNAEAKAILYELKHIKSEFADAVGTKELESVGASKEEAEKLVKYLSDPKTGFSEFMVHAATNEYVRKAVNSIKDKRVSIDWVDNLITKLLDMVDYVFNAVTNSGHHFNKSKLEQTMVLLHKLSNMNSIQEKSKGIVDKAEDAVYGMDETIATKIQDITEKLKLSKIDKDLNVYAEVNKAKGLHKLYVLGKNAGYLASGKTGRKVLRRLMGEVFGNKNTGVISTTVGNMMKSTSFKRIGEQLINLSGHIDQEKENVGVAYSSFIAGIIGAKKLSKEQHTAIANVVLKSDLSSLGMDAKSVLEVLNSSEVLDKKIASIEKVLKDKDVGQSRGLGYYMATGISPSGQELNAYNINPVRESDIDKLATLYALKYSNESNKKLVADFAGSNAGGLEGLMSSHRELVNKDKELYGSNRYEKGRVKETYLNNTAIVVVPRKAVEEYTAKGYKVVGKRLRAATDAGIRNNEDKYVFEMVNTLGEENRYAKTAIRLTDVDGVNIDYKRNKHNRLLLSIEESKIAKRDYDPTKIEAQYVKKVYNTDGFVAGYKYGVSPNVEDTYKKPIGSVNEYMGAGYRYNEDASKTKMINKEIVGVLVDDAEANIGVEGESWGNIGNSKNLEHYSWLSKDSDNKILREAWKVLPTATKRYIEELPEGRLPVRTNMARMYFGYRKTSIVDALPDSNNQAYNTMKRSMKLAGEIWSYLVSVEKVDIILKTPNVLTGNVISNTMLGINQKISPIKIVKYQIEGLRYIMQYQKLNKRYNELLARETGGENVDKEIVGVYQAMQASPIKKMIDAGHFSPIMEDLNSEDITSRSTGEQLVNNAKNAMPGFLKVGLEYAFFSSSTAPFKLMEKATYYSDFVFDYAVMKSMEEKGPSKMFKKKMSEDMFLVEMSGRLRKVGLAMGMDADTKASNAAAKHMMFGNDKGKFDNAYKEWLNSKWYEFVDKKITDNTIHYATPDHEYVQYANDIGLFMFTKYFTRIQKVIKDTTLEHPLLSVGSLLSQWALAYNAEDVQDASMFTKDYGHMIYTPLDTLEHVLTPTLVELMTGKLKI